MELEKVSSPAQPEASSSTVTFEIKVILRLGLGTVNWLAVKKKFRRITKPLFAEIRSFSNTKSITVTVNHDLRGT